VASGLICGEDHVKMTGLAVRPSVRPDPPHGHLPHPPKRPVPQYRRKWAAVSTRH